jgi:hypothetical protein
MFSAELKYTADRILSYSNKARERNKSNTNRKGKVKLPLVVDYMIQFWKDLRTLPKNS